MNKKIVNYLVVTNEFGEIEDDVNQLVDEGWQPIGGVSVALKETKDGMKHFLYQALVFYGEDKPTD